MDIDLIQPHPAIPSLLTALTRSKRLVLRSHNPGFVSPFPLCAGYLPLTFREGSYMLYMQKPHLVSHFSSHTLPQLLARNHS